MSEGQRKTAGLAIASLICGLFFLIPILGGILGLAAIIMGIIALVKISGNKENLKGNGLAISGIILGVLGMLIIPILLLMAAIAVPNMMRAKIAANDELAKSTLYSLSTASETYNTANGQYPSSEFELTQSVPPYIANSFCETTVYGYMFSCQFSPGGYEFVARPEGMGTTGTSIFTMKTGSMLSVEKGAATPAGQ